MVSTRTAKALIACYDSLIRGRSAFRYWRELEKSQWWSRERLESLQLERLRKLFSHAMGNCRFYRDTWLKQGLDVPSLASLSDLQRWPLLTKEVIRKHSRDIVATGSVQRSFTQSTGGSSGEPLQFRISKDSYDRRVAATYRGYNWAGAGPGTKQFYLWGVPLGARSWLQRGKEGLYNALHRREVYNTFTLNNGVVADVLARMQRFRPDVVVAYSSAVHLVAQACRQQSLQPYQPRSIVVGAEKLHEFQRAEIEEVFQAPVFETYGAREFMLMAAECEEHSGLHVTMENLIVEIVDDDGNPTRPGEEGNVAVTDLTNYAQPFIRYLNGDRAIAIDKACPCGRPSVLLQSVSGRSTDFIFTRDGRSLSGLFFPHLLKDYAAIIRFQVVQQDLDSVSLRVVLQRALSADEEQSVREKAQDYLGSEIRLVLEPVADIPLTKQGKRRVVVSSVSPPQSRAAALPGDSNCDSTLAKVI